MKKFLIICFLILCHGSSNGQGIPRFRQFFFNPQVFNPAFTGTHDHVTTYLAIRKQWLDIEDAPTVSSANVVVPINTRTVLGFNFIADKAVALKSNSASSTFAYKAPLTKERHLYLGLSVGASWHSLDLGDVDYSNDPTILNAAGASAFLNGNFGAVYKMNSWMFGFALPQLFPQKYFSPGKLGNTPASQLLSQIYSISRDISFKGSAFVAKPYFIFRMNRDLRYYWDASIVGTYNKTAWFGISYQHTQSSAAFLGFEILRDYRFSYCFEVPHRRSEQGLLSSHELAISIRVARKNDKD